MSELADAHNHGNCELCDALERQLAKAQGKLDAVWKVRTAMQKHRTVPTTRTVQTVLDPYISALARILKEENDG